MVDVTSETEQTDPLAPGALTNIGKESGTGVLGGFDLEDAGSKTVTFPVFTLQSQSPDLSGQQLQDIYGTEALPIFEWVKTVQSGTVELTPENINEQKRYMRNYRELMEKSGVVPEGFPEPDDLETSLDGLIETVAVSGAALAAQSAGGQIGSALVDPYLEGSSAGTKILEGAKATWGDTPGQLVADATNQGYNLVNAEELASNQIFQPELANAKTAAATGNSEIYANLKDTELIKGGVTTQEAVNNAAKLTGTTPNFKAETITATTQTPSGWETFGDSITSKQTWSNAAGVGLSTFAISLAMGSDVEVAAKQAVGATAGKAVGTSIGTAIGGPIGGAVGGFIGSVLGSSLGGRVICNELMRQGVMTRKQVILDYRFTRDYLTPQHVRGYHVWAIWMVRQMRKGSFVGFWKHVAGHRANEIAYIYGERDKPDYLGKLYRSILEPTCWVVGAFCKKSDWSILYKSKEI